MQKNIDEENVYEHIEGKSFIIYKISEMKLGENADSQKYKDYIDEMIEARFFDEKEELHIWKKNGALVFTITNDENEEYVYEYQYLRDKNYKELEIKRYLDYDKYGQAYVKATRPVRFI